MTGRVEAEFAPAKESVSWARDALEELRGAAQRFFQDDVVQIVTEFDSHTGESVQKAKLRAALPQSLRRKATEALTTSRHAFDQATFAARNLTSGRSAKSIYYPWSQSPTDLDRLLKARGLAEDLWAVFHSHQPYPTSDKFNGGNNRLRALAGIANDKHTVGISVMGEVAMLKIPDIVGGPIISLKLLSPVWDSARNEVELVRWIGNVQVNGEYEFDFVLALQDTRLDSPLEVVMALSDFCDKASSVIESLQEQCEKLEL